MIEKRTSSRRGTRRVVSLLVFAALCVGLTAAVGIPSAGALKPTVIGKTKHTPRPACPKDTNQNPCTATGRVTGFMLKAAGHKHPYNIFKDGKIVAWAIDLSKPTKDQYDFFGTLLQNDTFGKHPSARISVIKNKGHKKYKLLKQTPAIDVKPDLGRKQTFTLQKPLRVHRGQVVALSLPSWAPAFTGAVSANDNEWRASRRSKKCNVDRDHIQNAKASKAQQKIGSVRPYKCDYSAARLLYWAYFVPSKKK
jgi:hypothetical protein